jgi:hypothetical protein
MRRGAAAVSARSLSGAPRPLMRVSDAAPQATLSRVLPSGMWGRELLLTAARPRALLIRTAVPLVLTVPLVLGGAPTFWAAMLLTVLVAMVGAVGSGVAVARARTSGFLARLAVVPRPPERTVGLWLAAATTVDALQLAPALLVVLAGSQAEPVWWPLLAGVVFATLLAANVLGAALALFAEGPGEVLLDVGVITAPLLYLAGTFTGVPRTGWRATIASSDPFAATQSAMVGALGGSPAHSAAWCAAAAAVLLAITALLTLPLARAMVRPR